MVSRIPKSPGNNGDGPGHLPTSSYFGINTFGARQMRDKLPKDVYAKLVAAIRHGKKLDLEIAPTVATSLAYTSFGSLSRIWRAPKVLMPK